MEKGDVLRCALEYADKGYSVIPVGKDKKPLIKWEEFQKRHATKKEIMEWFTTFKEVNIGIVTGKISDLAVIDLDDIQYLEALEDFLPPLLEMPIVSTPRGGRHFYFHYPKEEVRNATNILRKVDVRGEGGYVVAPPSNNGNGKSYKWLDGFSLNDTEKENLPEELLKVIKDAVLTPTTTHDASRPLVSLSFEEGNRDNSMFHIANSLIKGGMSKENAELVLEELCKHSLKKEKKEYSLKEARDKVESALKRAERTTKRDFSVSAEVEKFVTVTDGDFSVTDVVHAISSHDSPLHSVTGVTIRDNVRQALKRLKDKGVIKKSGKKDGIYRRVDDEVKVLDIFSAAASKIDIEWPFDIQGFFNTMHKNIIMVAGESDAGKTAFLLNLAIMNVGKGMKIKYFSSEMGSMELYTRCTKFDYPLEKWRGVEFIEKSSDFADTIDPNGINIIDFLEIHDEFYKVGGLIKDIFDKLEKGIAVIAIQKNPGTDTGLGGERSREKARLYLSIERRKEGGNRIKVVKAKNWAMEGFNPNGLYLHFKLAKGCLLKPEGTWRKDGFV